MERTLKETIILFLKVFGYISVFAMLLLSISRSNDPIILFVELLFSIYVLIFFIFLLGERGQ